MPFVSPLGGQLLDTDPSAVKNDGSWAQCELMLPFTLNNHPRVSILFFPLYRWENGMGGLTESVWLPRLGSEPQGGPASPDMFVFRNACGVMGLRRANAITHV